MTGARTSAGSMSPTGIALICSSRKPTPSSSTPPVAVIEATTGQFYVAVIVAAFVGMYAARRRE